MNSQQYGNLLYNAIRETLETMAFAEVLPCSIQIGDQEMKGLGDPEFDLSVPGSEDDAGGGGTRGATPPMQTDFAQDQRSNWEDGETVSSEDGEDPWGTPAAVVEGELGDDGWGTPSGNAHSAADDWGFTSASPASEIGDESWGNASSGEDDWGAPAGPPSEGDPWGESGASVGASTGFSMQGKDVNFQSLVEHQDDWIWSCMRVNSPDIHSVWFVVSKALAMELARNMYAGEVQQELESPIIRDIVAELTNVLGGRLMLLLEKMGGQFTLAVPDIGVGLPKLPDSATMETVLCKVLVDGEFPVMGSICFNKK